MVLSGPVDFRLARLTAKITGHAWRERLAAAWNDGMALEALLVEVPPWEMTAALFAGLENGSLRPIVGKEMPLSHAAEAHRAVLEPGAYGKIVLTP